MSGNDDQKCEPTIFSNIVTAAIILLNGKRSFPSSCFPRCYLKAAALASPRRRRLRRPVSGCLVSSHAA